MKKLLFILSYCLFMMLYVSAWADTLEPGIINGSVIFDNVSTCVGDYLSQYPVVPSTGLDVYLYSLNLSEASRTNYNKVNTWLDAQRTKYKAADFILTPGQVPSTGADFILRIGDVNTWSGLHFSKSNRIYQVGFPPYWQSRMVCPHVLPTSINSTGTTCDFNECPALIDVHLNFQIDTYFQSLISTSEVSSCTMRAHISDGAVSYIQAEASYYFDNTNLQSGFSFPLLVRSSNNPIKVSVTCKVNINQNENVVVNSETIVTTAQCGNCTNAYITADIIKSEFPTLTGYFDVSNQTEISPTIKARNSGVIVKSISPLAVHSSTIPSTKWIMNLPISPNVYSLEPSTFLDDKRKFFKMPSKNVTLQSNGLVDLGSTFISRPIILSGSFVFKDKGETRLASLYNPLAFSSVEEPSSETGIVAYGSKYPPMMKDAVSAAEGRSYSVLTGSYDSLKQQAVLKYELPVGGFSLDSGPLNGDGTLPTNWQISKLILFLGKDSVSITLYSLDPDFTYQTSLGNKELQLIGNELTLQVPQKEICLNKYELSFFLPPSLGTFCIDRVNFDTSAVHWGPNMIYNSVFGEADRNPCNPVNNFEEIMITLPADMQYSITSRLRLQLNGMPLNVTSIKTLSALDFPCGASSRVCASLQDGSNESWKSIQFESPARCYESDDAITFKVSASPAGATVSNAQYYLDSSLTPSGQPNSQMEIHIAPNTLSSNVEHSVKVSADVNGCTDLSTTYSFTVKDPLQLDCPPVFSVNIEPYETAIPASDSRIEEMLSQVTLTGGCDSSISLHNNMPASFLRGSTEVLFTAGPLTCKTVVKVESDHELSYIEGSGSSTSIKTYYVEHGGFRYPDVYSAPNIYYFKYDEAGKRILAFSGVNTQNSQTYKIVDANSRNVLLTNTVIGQGLIDGDFHPLDNDLIALISKDTNNQYLLLVFRDSLLLTSSPLTIPSGVNMEDPLIAWSKDGKYISVMYTSEGHVRIPTYNLKDRYVFKTVSQVQLYRWDISDLGAPPSLTSVNLAEGERSIQILYPKERIYSKNLPFLNTTYGVFGPGLFPFPGEILSGSSLRLLRRHLGCVDSDISRSGDLIFCYQGRNLAFYSPFENSNLREFPSGFPLNFEPNGGEVALSSDDLVGALSEGDKIYLYIVKEESQVGKISASGARNVQFRPVFP